MATKFSIGERVRRIATGDLGTVIGSLPLPRADNTTYNVQFDGQPSCNVLPEEIEKASSN